MNTLIRGRQAEQRACRYLNSKGLQLVTSNYRCKAGEIDLIMRDGSALVFVEVRYRRTSHFGSGAETVDQHKRAKLIRTAQNFLQQHPREQHNPARFDVVSLNGDNKDIHWIPAAFDA